MNLEADVKHFEKNTLLTAFICTFTYFCVCIYNPEYVEILYRSWFALSSVDYDSDAENEDL